MHSTTASAESAGYKMEFLSEFGTFACYFNAIVKSVELTLHRFAQAPLFSTGCILVAALLSVLTSKLLIKTVDLQFAQSVRIGSEESLIMTSPEERRSVMNLPSLLEYSAPRTCLGDALYEVFLLVVVVSMLRFSMHSGRGIYWYLFWSEDMGWGGFMLLFVVGVLLSSYLSFQSMEGVHVASVFINVAYLVCLAFVNAYQKMDTYEPSIYDFPHFCEMCVLPCADS